MRKVFRSGFRFEQLEGRRLLAADCCMQALPEMEIEHCEVAAIQCTEDESAVDDLQLDDLTDPATDPTLCPVSTTENASPTITPGTGATNPATSLNLTDGMDGFFGALNAEHPSETLSFTASANGEVDVVVASSLGGSAATVAVTDSAGKVIEPQAEGLEGFAVLTFEVTEGETYQLSISSADEQCEGFFQVTVGFEEFVDQHADEVGCESTEIELTDNSAELSGRLETAGDIDTFRFTAPTAGEMTLEMLETVDQARIGMGVTVQDDCGNVLATGTTNQLVQIALDVEAGKEYYISIAATEDQCGTYQLGLDLATTEPVVVPDCPAVEPVVVETPQIEPSACDAAESQIAAITEDEGPLSADDLSSLVGANLDSDNAGDESADQLVQPGYDLELAVCTAGLNDNSTDPAIDLDVLDALESDLGSEDQQAVDQVFADLGSKLDFNLSSLQQDEFRNWSTKNRGFQRV